MNAPGPYETLSLDEILEITASDAWHAPQLREQGRGLKLLADTLDRSVESMLTARSVAETGFEGVSAGSLHGRATELVSRTSEGHASIQDQHRIFFALSDQAEATHLRMTELRDERDQKLAKADPGERAGIREDYTHQARQYMRETTNGYVSTLRRSEWIKGYEGPRLPRDDEAAAPRGFRYEHTTEGPGLKYSTGPQLQGSVGGATLSPELSHSGPAGQSTLRTQSWVGFGSVGFGQSSNSKKDKKDRRDERGRGTEVTDQFGAGSTEREVLPPVIGARSPEMAADAGPTPRADGVVAPVIGARDSGQPGDSGQPQHRPDGLLPPVIGGRPLPAPTVGATASPNPVRPTEPRPRSGVAPAGVRSAERPLPAPSRTHSGGEPDAVAQPAPVTEFTRLPRERYEDYGHAVLRRAQALTEPEVQPLPAPAPSAGRRFRQEPEYETGPFLTDHNLGRTL